MAKSDPGLFLFRAGLHLEIELECELDDSRASISQYLAERGTATGIVDSIELNMVEGVEKLSAEFQRLALGDFRALYDG